jgi:long-subunit fatty acid transport protein
MKRILAAVILISTAGADPAFAQSKTGTTIGQFMAIEPSARASALGNAGVALYDGIQSVYYNAGALGALPGISVQFTYSAWFAGITYNYAAGALPLRGFGTVFASVTALNSGDIAVRTVSQPDGTGEQYTVSNTAIGLGFGRQITSRFGAGIQLNYISEQIWHSSVGLLSLNLGTVYRLSEDGLKIGASLSNLGTQAAYSGRDLAFQYDQDPDAYGDNSSLPGEQHTDEFPLPVLFRVGVSYPRQFGPQSRLLVLAEAVHPSDNSESVSAGLEWTWNRLLSLRAGYQNMFEEDSELGPSLGVGLQLGIEDSRLHFDYAWVNHSRLQETHRMTVVLEF